jgi:hypothetical protein
MIDHRAALNIVLQHGYGAVILLHKHHLPGAVTESL